MRALLTNLFLLGVPLVGTGLAVASEASNGGMLKNKNRGSVVWPFGQAGKGGSAFGKYQVGGLP